VRAVAAGAPVAAQGLVVRERAVADGIHVARPEQRDRAPFRLAAVAAGLARRARGTGPVGGTGRVGGEGGVAEGQRTVGGDGPPLPAAAHAVAARDAFGHVAGERALGHDGGAVVVERPSFGAAAPRREPLFGI